MTQYEKSCSTLELPAILEQLAQQAVSASAKERALALAPSTDTAEVKKRLAETSAARAMMVPAPARVPAARGPIIGLTVPVPARGLSFSG